MATATHPASAVPAVDSEEATMISDQLAEQLTLPLLTDQVVDDIATSAVRDFLLSVDPGELEARALSMLGGLQGEESVGSAMLRTLRELAGVE